MSCAESSADGTGKSRMDVRRDAVEGYALADARTMAKILRVSNVVGVWSGSMDWKRSGCLESTNH